MRSVATSGFEAAHTVDFLRTRGIARDPARPARSPTTRGIGRPVFEPAGEGEDGGGSGAPPASYAYKTSSWPGEDIHTFGTSTVRDVGFTYNNATWAGRGLRATTRVERSCVFAAEDLYVHVLRAQIGDGFSSGRFPFSSSVVLDWGSPAGEEVVDATGAALSVADSYPSPVAILNRVGQLVGVVFVTAAAAPGGAALWFAPKGTVGSPTATPIATGAGEYLQPSGVAYRGRCWVVYVGDAPTKDEPGNIYLVVRGPDGTWGTPVQVNEGDAVCSFPTVAVSGNEDANGDGSVLVVAWRTVPDPADEPKEIHTRSVAVFDFDDVGGFSGAYTDSGDVRVTTEGEVNRDPAVWCSAEGRFFLGYTNVTGVSPPVAIVGIRHTTSPAHGGAWSGYFPLDTTSTDRQDYIFGCVNDAQGRCFVVWEYGPSKKATVYGAWCELSDPEVWTVLGKVSDETLGDEFAQFPCCTLADDGTASLWFLRSAAEDAAVLAVRFQEGTLS